jgi:hypothetical protein
MGDRANIYVKSTPENGVFLYAHWGGGFGISTGISDNEHPILIVDPFEQKVSLGSATVPPVPVDGKTWSFEEFLTGGPTEDDE